MAWLWSTGQDDHRAMAIQLVADYLGQIRKWDERAITEPPRRITLDRLLEGLDFAFPSDFSRPDRDTNIARIGYVAGKLAKHGVAVLVAAISPYRAARDQVRVGVDAFVEVHVAAPVAICAERDVKGLYAKALAGQIPNFTGVSDPYEPPLDPEIILHTEDQTVDESVDQVLTWLETNRLTSPTNR